MVKITNSNILSVFRKQIGISKADEIAFAEAFQSIFEEALLQDKILKISGLGTFKLIPVESRKSVNVNTGEEIEIAGHYKLTFTPDALLKDKVNEPLSHLETVELDADVVIENQDEVQNIISQDNVVEENQESVQQQDDPLQKLAEQALELKDILADIQGLGGLSNGLAEEKIEEEQIVETIVEKENVNEEVVVEEVVVEEVVVEQQEDAKSEEPQVAIADTPIVEDTPKMQVSDSASVSGQDIINAINKEDSLPDSKHSKGWIWVAVVLFLGIIGLLVYQNIDFFAPTVVAEVDTTIIADVEEEPVEVIITPVEDSISNFDVEIDSIETIESHNPIDTIVVDKTSPIYSEQFSDIFNRKREYTEFIDTVVLNEGSRLTWISLKQYGHKDYWVYIYEANRDIVKNPNAIKIGTQLRIPKLAEELIDTTNPETIEYARYLHDVYVRR
jgi:nucleoid DNA-binding protein/nucleoid-associated protein YgaU